MNAYNVSDLELIYPEIALVLGCFVLLGMACSRKLSRYAPQVAFLVYAVGLWLAFEQWGQFGTGFSGRVNCDGFGVVFKGIFIVASMITLLLGQNYLKIKRLDRAEYYALMLVSTVGMMAMANTTDLIVMLIGLEVMSVPLYVLAAFNRRSLRSNEAGIKYFMMGAFASAILLMGIAFIYGTATSQGLAAPTDICRIADNFDRLISNQETAIYLITGAALVLAGFGFKIAAVPFHSWVPDVYEGAPTPVTAFFSVAPKAAGFAVMLRIFTYGFEGFANELSMIFWILAVLTMSVGNILAFRQDNVKRMLAYSSISHAGYVLVALAVGIEAVPAAVFYLAAYTLFNLGAFAILTMLETRSGYKSDFAGLAGMAGAHPYLTATLALFMFALAGFPPTAGFFGKFYVFKAAIESGMIWLTVIGVMNSFVSVYFYLRVIRVAFFEETKGNFPKVRLTPAMLLALVIAVVGTLGIGFFPHQLLELSGSATFLP